MYKSFDYKDERISIIESTYENNGRLALQLEAANGEPYATLTTNLPDYPLEEGEFFVKTWSENKDIAQAAMASGWFEDTGKRVPTGYVKAEVWKFKVKGNK